MKIFRFLFLLLFCSALTQAATPIIPIRMDIAKEQVPTWSQDDMEFFLYGSMSTEVVPEAVLRAFEKIYPDLNLFDFGLIPGGPWPIGFSRKSEVKHLGGLSAVGINCASCHVAQITSASATKPLEIRVLGATSHFNVEAFFGSVIVATFKTADPGNMRKFLEAYSTDLDSKAFEEAWGKQAGKVIAAIKEDPFGAKDIAPGDLHKIDNKDVQVSPIIIKHDVDLAARAHSILKLFHNMRAALHVSDQPPEKAPPASGPGRNDAFGLLAASLLNSPQPYSPIKFGLVWNVDKRTWVHWDGNTKSPLARNLLASLGLGAPMHGKHGDLEFAAVKRQTDLSEKIRPPRYPFKIDNAAAKRGAPVIRSELQFVSRRAGERQAIVSGRRDRDRSAPRGNVHSKIGRRF